MPTDQTYAQNHQLLLDLLKGNGSMQPFEMDHRTFTLRLERILFDQNTQQMVPFDGAAGIEAVLRALIEVWDRCQPIWHDGHLMGYRATRSTADGIVATEVTLGAGGQMICTVGPTSSVASALAALEDFDRAIHVASCSIGCSYGLVAEGYNAFVDSPLDVSLVPRTKWTMMSAHFTQTGRYARDAMRCTCSTQLSYNYGSESEAIGLYRVAVALTPLVMFLTDNVRSFRGTGARRCPLMVRSVVWDEVDPARCGVVPGTFGEGFSFERYLAWLENTMPMYVIDDEDNTTSTGKRTLATVMSERSFSRGEAMHILHTVHPLVRLDGRVELLQADALRPRMAAGLCAFMKGLLCNGLALDSVSTLFASVKEHDVSEATRELRLRGWDATVYGLRVPQLVDSLIRLSRTGLEDGAELRSLDELAQLWEVCMVPRDAFVRQEIKAVRGW